MISDAQLRRLARGLDVRLGYAEKNYVNSWILWAIYTSSYGDNLLFKGGTALSKLYFPETWRYSEDLDFGVEGEYQGSEAGVTNHIGRCNESLRYRLRGDQTQGTAERSVSNALCRYRHPV